MGLGERRTVQQTGHAVGMAVKTTGAAWGVDHLRSSMGLLHLCLSEVATAMDPPLTQEGPPQIMGEGGRRVQAEVGGACGVVQGGCSVGMYGSGYQRSTTLQVFCICEPAMSVILPLFQVRCSCYFFIRVGRIRKALAYFIVLKAGSCPYGLCNNY
jgi:hypothetical protein